MKVRNSIAKYIKRTHKSISREGSLYILELLVSTIQIGNAPQIETHKPERNSSRRGVNWVTPKDHWKDYVAIEFEGACHLVFILMGWRTCTM